MEDYSLIVLIDCCTSFESVFVNTWSYCQFPRDVMGATLDDTMRTFTVHVINVKILPYARIVEKPLYTQNVLVDR